MGKKFDISDAFAKAVDVSRSDTSPEQIELIDNSLIDDDPNNFYQLTGLEELAANIELVGLQQPIRVRPAGEGRYTIVSGHRRRAAMALLGEEKWRKVPCIVERDEASPELRELRLILANSATRVLTPAEISRQAERVELLLYQLKEQGMEFPGRMRDQVAAACQVSASKLARLKVIREKLAGEWTSYFDSGMLAEQTAYALARMPEELQRRLHKAAGIKNLTAHAAERILSLSQSGATWTPACTCPDGSPCRRGDYFLRHDVDHSYPTCKGETCCLECREAKSSCYACDRMCSKAQALRKDARDKEAAKAEKRKAQEQKKYQEAIQASAIRLLKAAEAAGLKDEEQIVIKDCRPAISVRELWAYATGDFLGRYFYGNDLDATRFDHLDQLAKKLQCSADYLLGLTDELHPGESRWHWWPERPEKSGFYWVVTGPLSTGGGLYWWESAADQWEHWSAAGLALNVDAKLWMECPELPDSMAWTRKELDT